MKSFAISLPAPPSVNHLYPTGSHGRRFKSVAYANWIKEATYMLRAVHPPKFAAGVEIDIAFPDKGRMDLDSRCKATIDLLVREKIIVDDARRYVRRIVLSWADLDLMRVVVAECGKLPTITYSES